MRNKCEFSLELRKRSVASLTNKKYYVIRLRVNKRGNKPED